MSNQSDRLLNLHSQLLRFGLNEEEADLLIFLTSEGRATPLAASRYLGVPRTNVYRAAERLVEKELIRISSEGRGQEYVALGPRALETFVAAQQKAIDDQKLMLPNVLGELANMAASDMGSRVMHYSGAEGLYQVTLNSASATSELRIFELSNMSAFMSQDKAEEIRRMFADRGVRTRQLTNLKRLPAVTDVAGHIDLWEPRYIDPAVLQFDFELLIYDDVYVVYSYRDGDIFCLEIHSNALARTQARLFDFVWNSAVRMRKVGRSGEARLK